MINQTYILVVDDNDDDRSLVRRALPKAHVDTLREFISAENFKEDFLNIMSEEYFKGNSFPNLLFLDLRMEDDKSGIEILKEIRSSQFLKLIPVIIISSSDNNEDIMESFVNGANLYIAKGDDPAIFTKAIREIFNAINTSGRLPSDVPNNIIFKQ